MPRSPSSIVTNARRAARPSTLGLVVLATLLGRESAALAAHVEARLLYERGVGAETCADEGELRSAVAARLGYDPFVAIDRDHASADTVVVRIRRVGSSLEGLIERQDSQRRPRGKPAKITSASGDCSELLTAIAVGTAIAVDPIGSIEPHAEPSMPVLPPAPPNAPAAPPSPPLESPPPPPSTPPSTPTQLVVGAGASVAFGALPAASFGPRAIVGIAHGMFELDVEGRFDAPVRYYAGVSYVDTSIVLGTVAPCFRFRFLLSCAEVSLGALRGAGFGYDHTREANTLYATAGVREGLEVSLGTHFAARLNVEGTVVLRPTRLEGDGALLWSTPPFALSFSPLLIGRFP